MLIIEAICLSKVLFGEARSEPRIAQEAIAEVVLNRVHSNKFPNTICEVVNQPHQFTSRNPSDDNYWRTERVYVGFETTKAEIKLREGLDIIARDTIYAYETGEKKHDNVYHYHRKDIKPKWSYKLKPVDSIGVHIFYEGY